MGVSRRNRRRIGGAVENQVARYLARNGLTLTARNFQCRTGEIDLIARDDRFLIFIEVRYRSNSSHGSALESVTFWKQRRIVRCAQVFLTRYPVFANWPCRFDVVGVSRNSATSRYDVNWVKGAFLADI